MPHLFSKITGSIAFLTCLSLGLTAQAATITNGGFNENLDGWTVINQPDSFGNWYHTTGGIATLGGQPILDPIEGEGYAHSTQTGPTSQVLFQDIVLEADTEHFLSFDWYAQDWGNLFADAGTLDYLASPNQHLRVDLVSTDFDDWFGADASSGVLASILAPVAEMAPVSDWNSLLNFDLTPWAGESVRLAFRQVDNQWFFNAGIDNVRISSDPNGSTSVPEPSILVGITALGVSFLSSRTNRSKTKSPAKG